MLARSTSPAGSTFFFLDTLTVGSLITSGSSLASLVSWDIAKTLSSPSPLPLVKPSCSSKGDAAINSLYFITYTARSRNDTPAPMLAL